MTLLVQISRYITANSNRSVHIADAFNMPLCGGNRGTNGYSITEGEPTCKRCIRALSAMDESEMNRRHKEDDLASTSE